MTLHIYTINNNFEGTWDEAIASDNIEVVDTILGEDNADCESKASDYTDSDKYGWAYTDPTK